MKISGWDKWQSFRKDRGTPPWIKIHRNLMSNEQWVELTDAEKGQLVSIWILGADKNGVIPDSPAMIQRMAMLSNKPNINKFIELGFLSTTCQPLDSHKSDSAPQLDPPEKRREEENMFDLFWKNYPRKDDKKTAKTVFNRLSKDQKKKATDDCKERYLSTEKKFIPLPATYINKERWNDEGSSKPKWEGNII